VQRNNSHSCRQLSLQIRKLLIKLSHTNSPY